MVEEKATGLEPSFPAPFSLPGSEVETPAALTPTQPDEVIRKWQKGYRQLQLIHQLTLAVAQANELETIYQEALRGLQEVVGTNRAAVLLFDEAGVMQFVAWRGLSDAYRQAAAGHSPWTPDAPDPQPLLVSNVAEEASLAALADRITAEGIHALAFIPLLYQGRLMGKFMLYYDQPHLFTAEEVQLAQTIAGHVAFAIERQRTTQALQEARDLLEQRVAARTAELRQRNDTLQTLARNIPKAAVFLFDQELRLKLVEGEDKIHPSFYKGAEGQTIWELMPPAEYEKRGRYYQEALQGKSHVYERAVNGRTLQVYVLPIQNDQGQIEAVMTMAQDITDHKEAQATLMRRLREREALALINQALSETLDMALVLELIAVSAQQIIPNVDWAVIHLLDDKKQLLYPAAVAGLELPSGEYVLHPGEGIGGRAIEEGKVINVANIQQDPRRAAVHQRLGLRALLVCPVQSRTRRLGTITIHRGSAERFSAEDEQLLGALGSQVAMAIENARLFKQIEAGRERLRQLTQQVISAQEAERRRISYDLHDEAGQALTAVKINLSLLAAELPDSQESLRRELLEVRDMVSGTMEQIRLLAHDLRPPIVDSFSLNLALENMCKEFGHRTHYQATYRGEELPSPIGDEVTISFYRFVQEALTNVMKHAGATQVEVVLRLKADRIVVSVTDNGRGFDYEEGSSFQGRSGGIGLAGMQERFDLLGGQLEIHSMPGKGTTVTAYAPYQIGEHHD